jgi:hypothetical protein
VLLLTDISVWKNTQMSELISSFETYLDDPFDDNKITLSYNPMMTLALTAEILQRIGKLRRRFYD